MQHEHETDTAADYSYDLAHEAVSETSRPAEHRDPTQVSTVTPEETGGDYSYDLAHDVPPAG